MQVVTLNEDKTGILHRQCELVDNLRSVEKHIEGMKELLFGAYNGTGKGLAAPQVGLNKRMFILRFGNSIEVFINPEIIKAGSNKITIGEGCLSVPGTYYNVTRPRKIGVKYLNERMLPQRAKFHDFDAVAFQHELDHLDGVLICDKGKAV